VTRSPAIPGQRDRLASHVMSMLGARGIYAVSKWAAIACMAKLGSATMVGQYGLGIAIALPVFGLKDLQLRSVQATDARHEHPFPLYLGLRLITIALAIIIMIGIAISSYDTLQAQIIILVGLFKASESLADICYGALQQQEQMNRMAVSIILRSILSTIGLASALFWNADALRLGLIYMLAMSLLVWVIYDLPQVARLRLPDGTLTRILPAFPPQGLAHLTWLSLPLGIVMMLSLLQFNIPRYMLDQYHGSTVLGIFAGIAYFVDSGMQFIVAIGNTFSPRLARHFANGDLSGYLKLFLRFSLLCITPGLMGVAVALLAGSWMLSLLLSKEYLPYSDLFAILMLAGTLLFARTATGVALTATRQFKRSLMPGLVNTLISLLVCWMLIPRWGLYGAGWAMVIIAAVSWLIMLGVTLHIVRQHHRFLTQSSVSPTQAHQADSPAPAESN